MDVLHNPRNILTTVLDPFLIITSAFKLIQVKFLRNFNIFCTMS